MSIVLYVGGSKDGDKGVVPYGFNKTRTITETGPEVYVQRTLSLAEIGTVRVMALESLQEDILIERAADHYARRAS
ncbi:hypothetical protein FUT69_08105 [Xylella taiwanensis]|uniref:Uncharacterized protein n=1 Tax=Xylella taiwanensis TaxID=1444770 RepID=Z9JFP6_9GAMM|nr:hypothetical protein [Xylella taiwanensis]AXI83664.1 hypothetical protein AB672_06830 [Xylella taiwanensis]EWS77230.1 hypothetical protein AF72_11965 [Xylella taiwanensis]MCD8456752.1 hypothetical protein [Xylella taiwanensis]MCD8459162.1 hypothetical protein [Xylella taiwanensis]MCD8461946.1 hypothetical protein [Xylella taiwanensis]